MEKGDGPEMVVVVVHGDVEVMVRPVGGQHPDLDLIDRLIRLQLVGRRLGWSVHLRHPTPELCELIELVGLTGVLGAEPATDPEPSAGPGGPAPRGAGAEVG